MKEIFKILLLIICLGLAGVFFVNTVNDDIEEETDGKHHIKSYSIISNNKKEVELEFALAKSSKDKVNPSVRILTKDDPVYEGEGQIKDSILGKVSGRT